MDRGLEGREHIRGAHQGRLLGRTSFGENEGLLAERVSPSLRQVPKLELTLQGRISCPFSDTD